MVGAVAAVDLTGLEVDIGNIEVKFLALAAVFRHDGNAVGTHQMTVLVDNDLETELILERLDDADVLADAALEYDRSDDLLALRHVVQVVGCDRTAQSGDDVLLAVTHLQFVNQVGFREYRAARGDVGRIL